MLKSSLLVGSALALLSSKAFAHYPTLDCEALAGNLHCIAGYSDGSVAYNETVQIKTYSEELIETLTTDDNGEFTTSRPQGEYYLVFNPGHEDPAEFDYAEL
ncbi:hypothetical protein J9B83_12560 [Marinomonas sp. A79]|uniref:Cna protein B-type domain protein n=1 Tax=Marinomonas vulgaris TaxID=2823372 RepID=A0ABS5HDR3_9GAMM|nr:hypothetical protein [Marinomonas vulgaris]MBR7889766.1 hypothetical protein [Marinomonas vulgaris]